MMMGGYPTQGAELVDGADDPLALVGARAAAPFAVQRHVQEIAMLLLRERNTGAQFIREGG